MARQYTAWVVQEGKGKDTRLLYAPLADWVTNPKLAMQFARRSDARRMADSIARGRPVEKSFG